MTTVAFIGEPDKYGSVTQQLAIAVPRHRDPLESRLAGSEPYLATYATTEFARRDDADRYLVTPVARTTSYEVINDGSLSVPELRDAIFANLASGPAVSLRVIGHSRMFYDGDAYIGLPLGQVGDHGLAVRSETLVFGDGFLDDLFDPADLLTIGPRPPYLDPGAAAVWGAEYPAEFRDIDTGAGRLPALRRDRRAWLAGRLLRRRGPAPVRRPRPRPRATWPAARPHATPSAPRARSITTITICCPSRRSTPSGSKSAPSTTYASCSHV